MTPKTKEEPTTLSELLEKQLRNENWKKDLEKMLRMWHYDFSREDGINQIENFITFLLSTCQRQIIEAVREEIEEMKPIKPFKKVKKKFNISL